MRYERGSVLISSNLPFSKWEAIFKDPMTTAAAIDRLVHHSVILELNIPSYRIEQAKKNQTVNAARIWSQGHPLPTRKKNQRVIQHDGTSFPSRDDPVDYIFRQLLAVKTQPPILTGIVKTKTKIVIEQGKQSVTQKLQLRGSFDLHTIHFTNPGVQDKVDMLSLRARGEPKEARPGAQDINSLMQGDFTIGNRNIAFSRLTYMLPGAQVNLAGVYSMDGQQFEFSGKVRTKATLRKMVASWWKSWLLTPISPFFKKDGVGAEIPFKVSGTRSEPKFGLNFPHGHSDNGAPKQQGGK